MTKHIDHLIELEKSNPLELKDYCYRDGCPTNWTREPLTAKQIARERIPYYCEECGDRAFYNLKQYKNGEGVTNE